MTPSKQAPKKVTEEAVTEDIVKKFGDEYEVINQRFADSLDDMTLAEIDEVCDNLQDDFNVRLTMTSRSMVIIDPAETVSDETRWTANAFWEGGRSKNLRLDELHNSRNPNTTGVGDTTDYGLAAMILQRAGLGGHEKFQELRSIFGRALLYEIDNPREWLNPNVHVILTQEARGITGTDSEIAGMEK